MHNIPNKISILAGVGWCPSWDKGMRTFKPRGAYAEGARREELRPQTRRIPESRFFAGSSCLHDPAWRLAGLSNC